MTTEAPSPAFPPLALDGWRATRDVLHGYARLAGAVRHTLTPRLRHYAHVSLAVAADGLTTTPIPAGDGAVELRLDLHAGRLVVVASRGERRELALGQPVPLLRDAVTNALAGLGVVVDLSDAGLGSDGRLAWDPDAALRWHRALVRIDALFKRWKGERRRETSPVQLFPHHFDLAVTWFSGRLVPGEDPDDEGSADEQMTFGFSTGDENVPDAYLYATAYPAPDGFLGAPLPAGARWEDDAFTGALLPYAAVAAAADPDALVLAFLRDAHAAGASRMRG